MIAFNQFKIKRKIYDSSKVTNEDAKYPTGALRAKQEKDIERALKRKHKIPVHKTRTVIKMWKRILSFNSFYLRQNIFIRGAFGMMANIRLNDKKKAKQLEYDKMYDLFKKSRKIKTRKDESTRTK